MAKRYINYILRDRLGTYLEGLENAEVSFGISQGTLNLENVKVKDDAFKKLLLPMNVKFGTVKSLRVTVPYSLRNSPVEIILEDLALIVTPQAKKDWHFQDIYDRKFVEQTIMTVSKAVAAEIQAEQQQGFFDRLKLKILDNIIISIQDVHIRFEEENVIKQGPNIKKDTFYQGKSLNESSGSFIFQNNEDSNGVGLSRTTAGLLLKSLELQTVDENGKPIFHDRNLTKGTIKKILKLEGLAVYLNPQDTLLIHEIAKNDSSQIEMNKAQAIMDSVIQDYKKTIETQRQAQCQPASDSEINLSDSSKTELHKNNLLTYILKPMNLDLVLSRVVEPPKSLDLQIKLDKFEISMQHPQLRAILQLTHQIRNYKKEAMTQEKLRRFRVFRPIEIYEDIYDEKREILTQKRKKGLFDAKAWWKFAITSILRSIQFKRGSINAFKPKLDQLRSYESQFKSLLLMLIQCKNDTQRVNMLENKWTEEQRATFYHISTLFEKETIKQWITEVVKPLELAKYSQNGSTSEDQAKNQRKGYFSWIFSRPAAAPIEETLEQTKGVQEKVEESKAEEEQGASDSDDDLDEFFDCVDDDPQLTVSKEHMPKNQQKTQDFKENNNFIQEENNQNQELLKQMLGGINNSSIRNETSFQLTFYIKSFSMTLGKLSASNKIEGIQIFSRGGLHKITSPTLNIFAQYSLSSVLQEWGINLITLNRDTNSLAECMPVILAHKKDSLDSQVPQWNLNLTKNDPRLAHQEIEFDVNLKIGQIVVKYDQDLIIRAQSIARLKVNQEFKSDAIDQLEDLRETTQSRLHAIIYKKVNRYYFFLESPIFILPIKDTFKGKYSPVWILKTGNLTVQSAQSSKMSFNQNRFGNMSFTNQQQNELKMADIVREIMQKRSEEKNQFKDEDVYESFDIWISQASLHYYQSYRTYEKQVAQKNHVQLKRGSIIDQRQTLQKFQLLQDFELKIFLKLKKDQQMVTFEESQKEQFLRLPRKSLKINTSSINISLSHSIYNNLYNMKQIFVISKTKQQNYEREINEYNVQIRQQITQDALVEGFVTRKVFLSNNQISRERCYCILAGRYLYFYSEKDQLLYKDFFSLKNVTVTADDGSFINDMTNQNSEYEGPRFELTMQKSQNQNGDSLFQQNNSSSQFDLYQRGELQKLLFDSAEDLQRWVNALNQIRNEAILDQDATRGTIQGLKTRKSLRLSRVGHGMSLYNKIRETSKESVVNNDDQIDPVYQNTNMNEKTQEGMIGTKNIDIVKFEMDLSMPSFEVDLMKLKLTDLQGFRDDEGQQQQQSQEQIFEPWVKFAMVGLLVYRQDRLFDMMQKTQINKISLKDQLMVVNSTLMTQSGHNSTPINQLSQSQRSLADSFREKLGDNQNFDDPAIIIEKLEQQPNSERFEGIHRETTISMGNMCLNFMPNTINNMLKLMRATRLQTKPVDDQFLAAEEYNDSEQANSEDAESPYFVRDNNSPNESQKSEKIKEEIRLFESEEREKILNSVSINESSFIGNDNSSSVFQSKRQYQIDPEQEMVQNATDQIKQRVFESNCGKEKDMVSRMVLQSKKIVMGLIHPIFQMEVFRVEGQEIRFCYEVCYDHAKASCTLNKTFFYDLSGAPYTISPRTFYKQMKREAKLSQSVQREVLKNPRQMIQIGKIDFNMKMIYSPKCLHKKAGFGSQAKIRIQTLRLDHIQESHFRFQDYFMEQFLECLILSDPYQDPKKQFDELMKRQQINIQSLSEMSDFKQVAEIMAMDCEIAKMQIFLKDRPQNREFLMFEVPLVKIDHTLGNPQKRIQKRPNLLTQTECYNIQMNKMNFIYGLEASEKLNTQTQDLYLPLVKQPFSIDIVFTKVTNSEVIQKIDAQDMDKSSSISLDFEPIQLIWPQSIFTFMMRCNDLNIGFSDRLQAEYFFIKWVKLQDYYKQLANVVNKRFSIFIPALSLELQHSDGSFVAEIILTRFRQEQTNYMDFDKQIQVLCSKFYILDKANSKDFEEKPSGQKQAKGRKISKDKMAKKEKRNQQKQAIICPLESQLYFVSSDSIINSPENQKNCGPFQSINSNSNLEITSSMLPNRDKHNRMNIKGVKIFLRMQLFILLQAYFQNSFPVYKENSPDTPVGFNADPERDCILSMQMNIKDSLICLLNQPRLKSMAFLGDFQFVMLQDNIKQKKEQYEREARALNDERRFTRRNSTRLGGTPNARSLNGQLIDQNANVDDDDDQDLSNGSSTNDSSQESTLDLQQRDLNWIARIYLQKFSVNKFTSFVCQFRHLGKDCAIMTLRKRSLVQPMELIFESQFRLTRYQEFYDDQTARASSLVGHSQLESDYNNNNIGARTFPNRRREENEKNLISGFEQHGGISVDELANEDESPQSSEMQQNDQSDDSFEEEEFKTPTGQIHIILPKSPQNHTERFKLEQRGFEPVNDENREQMRQKGVSQRQSFKSGGLTTHQSHEWGVDQVISVFIGQSKMRISIKDVLLIIQLVQFASESMARDSLQKLQDIHDRLIEKEKLDQLLEEQAKMVKNGVNITDQKATFNSRTSTQYRSFSHIVGDNSKTPETNSFVDRVEGDELIDSQRKTIFDGLLEKLYQSNDETMKAQFQLLQSSTTAFSKIANGYTQKNYLERQTFLEFVVKDLMGDQKSTVPTDYYANAKELDQGIHEADPALEARNRQSTLKRIHTHNRYQNLLQSRMTVQALPQIQQNHEPRLSAVPESPEGRVSEMLSPEKRFADSQKTENKISQEAIEPIIFNQIQEGQDEQISLFINNQAVQDKNIRPISVHLQSPEINVLQESFNLSGKNSEKRKSLFFNPKQQNNTALSSPQNVQAESITDAVSEFFYSCSGRDKPYPVLDDQNDFGLRNSKNIENVNYIDQVEEEENKSLDQHNIGTIAMAAHENLLDTAQNSIVNRWSSQRQKRVGTSLKGIRPQLKMPQISEDARTNGSHFYPKASTKSVSHKQSNSVKYKHCLQNLRKKDSNMLVDTMNILFINDFDIGITPVLECEISSLEVKNDEDLAQKDSVMSVEIPMVTVNYFNLERGEWEPLLEQLAVQVNMNQTISQRTLIIEFPKQILLNLTLAWVRHYVYTKKAWEKTRVLLQQLLKSDPQKVEEEQPNNTKNVSNKSGSRKLKNSSNLVITQSVDVLKSNKSSKESSKSYSINSSSFDGGDRPFFPQKIDESSNDFIDESESSENEDEEFYLDADDVEDEMQSTSAFLIMNYTNSSIMVVQGGITDPLSERELNIIYKRQVNEVGQYGFSARFLNNSTQNTNYPYAQSNQFQVNSQDGISKKVLSVNVGQQGKYQVSFNQMISQQRQQLLNEQQERVEKHKSRFTQGQNFIFGNLYSAQQQDDQQDEPNRKSQTSSAFDSKNNDQTMKLQNKVYVGVKLNNIDSIQSIDLNEISDLDPYAFLLSSSFQFEMLANQARVVTQEDMGVDRNLQQFYSEIEEVDLDQQTMGGNQNLLDRNSYHMDQPDLIYHMQQRHTKAKNVIEKMKDDKLGLYYNYLFYGVIIDKMSKMLVVRTPYLFFNKTLLVIEVQIIFHTHKSDQEVQRFVLKQNDKFPLDFKYYDSHSIAFRVIESITDNLIESQSSPKNSTMKVQSKSNLVNSSQPKQRGFCSPIPIKQLIHLQINGAGIFRSGPENDGLSLCVKRQPGNLLGTTDLVFIPPITVKNTLPCSLKIFTAPEQLFQVDLQKNTQNVTEEPLEYIVETSEERQFFSFKGQGNENNEIDFKVQLEGFQISNTIALNQKRSEELDINLFDYQENQLNVGMRVQLIEAGYHVTIFAHTCILFDTIGLINSGQMSLFYENQGLGRQLRKLGGAQRRRIAGWNTVQENRFLLSNRDQALYIGIAEDSIKPSKLLKKEANPSSELGNQLLRETDLTDLTATLDRGTVNQNSNEGFSTIDQKESTRAFFYSPKLEIDGISKTEDFSIKTESIQFQKHKATRIRNKNNQFDFVMSTSLQLADSRESIYTKLVTLSPKYILVNHMRNSLEVAQSETIRHLSGVKKMAAGDKLEWFWPDHTKERLLIVRKAELDDEQQKDQSIILSPKSSKNGQQLLQSHDYPEQDKPKDKLLISPIQDKLSDFKQTPPATSKKENRTNSVQSSEEANKGMQWEWSNGFSLDVNDQMSFSVMICEDEGYTRKAVLPRKQSTINDWKVQYRKIIRVTKKLINGVVFVIFEDENPLYPMYRIINQCTNVKLQFEQAELQEKKIDEIGPLQQMNFGLYDPEGVHKILMTLTIDRNDFGVLSTNKKYEKGAKFSQMEEIDLLGAVEDQFKIIEFESVNGEPQQVIISLKNDGQTKTIFLHNILEVEDLDFYGLNEGVQTKNVRSGSIIVPSKDGILTLKGGDDQNNIYGQDQLVNKLQTVIQIDMHQLLISFIGNLQMSKNEILTQETKEICLMTIEGAKFIIDSMPASKRQDIEMRVNHFQIDNQIELNPIFQTIFLPKAYFGARRRQNHNDAAFPFFELRISSHMSPSNDVRFVDEFNCEFADTVFTIEDDFLIHAAWVYSQAADLLADPDSKVHPIFKKNNFCVLKDDFVEKIHTDITSQIHNMTHLSTTNSDFSRSQFISDQWSQKNRGMARIGSYQRTSSADKFTGNQINTFKEPRQMKLETIKEESVKNGATVLSVDSESQLQNSYEYGDLEFAGLKGSHLMSSHKARISNVGLRNSNEIDFNALQHARKMEVFAKNQPQYCHSNLLESVLISEKFCEITQEKAPQSQLRWYQQLVENTKQTFYLKNFFIESINIDFSFVVKSKDNSASEERRNFVGPLRYLKKSGLQVISIDEANFQFSRMRRSKIFISQNDLIQQASQHYNADFIQNVRKLIYRVSILQAFPTIFNSSRRGIRELSDLMQQGYEEEGILGGSHGFASGTISFTKHVSVGIFSSIQIFSQAVSDLLLLVTTDGDYSRARDDRMIIEKPKNFVEGIGFGSNCVWVGCTEGVLGLIKRPYIECKRRGFKGLMLGFYQGTIGLMTKPASSALDLVAKTSEGFKNTIRHVDVDMNRKRIRDPRPFYGRQMLIKPFNHKDALMINTVLHNVDQGVFKDDHFIEVRSVRTKSRETLALLLTEEHLFLIEMTQKELIWQVQTNLIAQVDKLRTGLIIGLLQEYEGQEQFVLPLDDRSSYEIQKWIENIAKQFN